MNILKFLMCIFLINVSNAQTYTSFFTGNSTDAITSPEFGVCLMGGSTENDNAMQWFLDLADGGDVLVLRASGSDGYNDYFFSQLGVTLNSVETIRINQASGALDPYVLQKVSQAEAIWFAGGDQGDYVNYFKDNALGDLLNEHINTKQYPIGGISAGMAIMGEYYFDALNGTITSNEALSDPFDNRISLGVSDFLDNSILHKTITDTHYDDPDRRGRHMVFLARLQAMIGERVFGIGLDEFTAACIGEDGVANIYGDFPSFDDYAYFIQINCLDDSIPENLASNQTLDWNLNQEAVKAYKVPGTQSGTNQFNLNTWEDGQGGEWQNWWVEQGIFQFQESIPVDCESLNAFEFEESNIEVYPNPSKDKFFFDSKIDIKEMRIYDILGRRVKSSNLNVESNSINLEALPVGTYFLKIKDQNNNKTILKLLKN